jgi:hypothetical protein
VNRALECWVVVVVPHACERAQLIVVFRGGKRRLMQLSVSFWRASVSGYIGEWRERDVLRARAGASAKGGPRA